MANQLAPFNKELATALQPLRRLLKKTADPFDMTKEQTLAFQKAKDILTSDKVIAYFRPGAPMQLFTDASLKNSLGFHLKQQQPDHSWKTIQTGSRTLTSAETRYAPIELELQAIVYATRKCHSFLAGTTFKLFTYLTICLPLSDSRSVLAILFSSSSFLLPQSLPETVFSLLQILSGYNGSPDTRFFLTTTRLMSWPDGERYLFPQQCLVVTLLLSLVSILLFPRSGGILSHLNSLTYRLPRFPSSNLCFYVMLAVFSLAFC